MPLTEKFIALGEAARKNIKEIDAISLNNALNKKEICHVIDVREDLEWNQGHIPHAIHLSKGIIERDIESQIPDANAKVVLYCGGGYRSALAAENLQKMNYKNILSLKGGFAAWKESGFDTEK